jgi:hypothetical protein
LKRSFGEAKYNSIEWLEADLTDRDKLIEAI